MTCPICGKHTLPGAKLCGPCRAALKRARDDSVWELPPGLKRPTGTPASESLASPTTRWVLGSRRSLGWRGWAAIMVAAGGIVGAGLKVTSTVDSSAVAATPVVRAASGSVAPSTAPLTSPNAPASGMDKAPTRDAVAAAEPAPRTREVVQPPRGHELHPVPSRAVKTPPPVVEAPPPVPAPAPVAPAEPVRIAAPALPVPVRPADPWQPLKDALAGCAAQSVFERIGCEHRARTRWCDGHWGEVAQCPGGVANDHGQ